MVRGGQLSETATTAPRGAGQFVRESLAGCPTRAIDDAATLAAEIATSCMAATGASAVRVNVERSIDAVRVEVHAPPAPAVAGHRYADLPELRDDLVEALADRWGVDHRPTERIVWFELEVGYRN